MSPVPAKLLSVVARYSPEYNTAYLHLRVELPGGKVAHGAMSPTFIYDHLAQLARWLDSCGLDFHGLPVDMALRAAIGQTLRVKPIPAAEGSPSDQKVELTEFL